MGGVAAHAHECRRVCVGVRDVNRLVDFLVERKIPAIFVESSVNEKNIRAVIEGTTSRQAKVQVGGELFSDAMGAEGTYEGTYIGMLDHNATKISRALGGSAPETGMNGRLSEKRTGSHNGVLHGVIVAAALGLLVVLTLSINIKDRLTGSQCWLPVKFNDLLGACASQLFPLNQNILPAVQMVALACKSSSASIGVPSQSQ